MRNQERNRTTGQTQDQQAKESKRRRRKEGDWADTGSASRQTQDEQAKVEQKQELDNWAARISKQRRNEERQLARRRISKQRKNEARSWTSGQMQDQQAKEEPREKLNNRAERRNNFHMGADTGHELVRTMD